MHNYIYIVYTFYIYKIIILYYILYIYNMIRNIYMFVNIKETFPRFSAFIGDEMSNMASFSGRVFLITLLLSTATFFVDLFTE